MGTYSVTIRDCADYLRCRHLFGDQASSPTRPSRIFVTDIQRAVASFFCIDLDYMTSGHRARKYARPRQIAMCLARDETRMSLPEIGRRFGGRDHTTVIHACRNIERLRGADPEVDYQIEAIRRRLISNRLEVGR